MVPHGGGDRQGARQRVVRAVKVGKRAAAANAYLDGVLALLPEPARAWASDPAIRVQWLPFAVAHVNVERRRPGSGSDPRHLVEAIELVWRERQNNPEARASHG